MIKITNLQKFQATLPSGANGGDGMRLVVKPEEIRAKDQVKLS